MSDTPDSSADGHVDYSHYSEAQLSGVLQRVDADKYPVNFANLKMALAARGFPVAEPTTVPEQVPSFAVAFAPEAGFLTWLGPSRNDFRLVGSGRISCDRLRVVVKGRRFGFILGLPLRRSVEIELADIVNVERDANVVRMECRTSKGALRSLTLWAKDATDAEQLVNLLPEDKTPDSVPQLEAHLAFEQRLLAQSPRLPVTYGFASLCVLMFIVTISHGAGFFNSQGIVEMFWGSNFGPSTIGGQWWRLLTYSLLHIGFFHLAFNMWALVSFGAIAERLYGSLRYAFICLIASATGGVASITAEPLINSVGASAVICGIFGALLVAHLRGPEVIPKSVGRSLRKSTLVFASVALVGGFIVPGVDNAAHLGGLAAGICVGLAFQSTRSVVRFAAPAALGLLIVVAGVSFARRARATSTAEAQYWEAFRWFARGESDTVDRWTELQMLARKSMIADDGLADRIDGELLPFWREASARLKPIRLTAGSKVFAAHQYLQSLADGRLHAMQLCVSGLRQHDAAIVGACMKEMGRVDQLIAEREKALQQ